MNSKFFFQEYIDVNTEITQYYNSYNKICNTILKLYNKNPYPNNKINKLFISYETLFLNLKNKLNSHLEKFSEYNDLSILDLHKQYIINTFFNKSDNKYSIKFNILYIKTNIHLYYKKNKNINVKHLLIHYKLFALIYLLENNINKILLTELIWNHDKNIEMFSFISLINFYKYIKHGLSNNISNRIYNITNTKSHYTNYILLNYYFLTIDQTNNQTNNQTNISFINITKTTIFNKINNLFNIFNNIYDILINNTVCNNIKNDIYNYLNKFNNIIKFIIDYINKNISKDHSSNLKLIKLTKLIMNKINNKNNKNNMDNMNNNQKMKYFITILFLKITKIYQSLHKNTDSSEFLHYMDKKFVFLHKKIQKHIL